MNARRPVLMIIVTLWTECLCFMPFHFVLLDPLNGNPIKLVLVPFKSTCSTLFYASAKKAVIVIVRP